MDFTVGPGVSVQAEGLTKRFGQQIAVDNIWLTVRQGEFFGFLGPNGAGKSTTIRMLCGLLTPSEGEIEVLGLRIPEQAETLRDIFSTMREGVYSGLILIVGLAASKVAIRASRFRS